MFQQVVRHLAAHWIQDEIHSLAPRHLRGRDEVAVAKYRSSHPDFLQKINRDFLNPLIVGRLASRFLLSSRTSKSRNIRLRARSANLVGVLCAAYSTIIPSKPSIWKA